MKSHVVAFALLASVVMALPTPDSSEVSTEKRGLFGTTAKAGNTGFNYPGANVGAGNTGFNYPGANVDAADGGFNYPGAKVAPGAGGFNYGK